MTSRTKRHAMLLASLCTLAVAAEARAGTQKTVYMSFGGITRSYVIYVPSLYTGSAAVPLVVDLHPYHDATRPAAAAVFPHSVAGRAHCHPSDPGPQ